MFQHVEDYTVLMLRDVLAAVKFKQEPLHEGKPILATSSGWGNATWADDGQMTSMTIKIAHVPAVTWREQFGNSIPFNHVHDVVSAARVADLDSHADVAYGRDYKDVRLTTAARVWVRVLALWGDPVWDQLLNCDPRPWASDRLTVSLHVPGDTTQ